ncbi:5-formyltetrahydrofolate cyclo-ligase [Candidatus Woesearchaeota archaeon]|nr:5-formyltetrahydrofolate cyclo-ligase [Candidatus Woesearchaeota archaeon]
MKESIKKNILEARNSLSLKQIKEKSRIIKKNLLDMEQFQNADVIHCYISKESEVSTHDLISGLGKTWIIPCLQNNCLESCRFNGFQNLKKGSFGILEPKKIERFPEERIKMVLVPGIAFDTRGYRLGYGKGYYDRFLKNSNAVKIGLAYDFQIVNNVPEEKHDVKVDCIITEKRIIRCKHD